MFRCRFFMGTLHLVLVIEHLLCMCPEMGPGDEKRPLQELAALRGRCADRSVTGRRGFTEMRAGAGKAGNGAGAACLGGS